jgi:SagB-type dehydrogenase family enzyme
VVARVRRAESLVVVFHEGRPVVWNFLGKRSFACTPAAIQLLAAAEDWMPLDRVPDLLPDLPAPSLAGELGRLIELGALVVEGTAGGERDDEYRDRWEWGAIAGLFHFAIKDEPFADEAETEAVLGARARRSRSPGLVQRDRAADGSVELDGVDGPDPLIDLMWSRRSRRTFGSAALRSEQLGRVLYSALGITGEVHDPTLGTMPLSMTPSGGARNPYEAYVYVRSVDGVDPGIYHYDARAHVLAPAAGPPLPPAGALLSGQAWADDAGAIVFLVARFERTMWKYGHPNSYRVVLIEAGHIGQNLLLTATDEGLCAAPTAALQDAPLEALLGLGGIAESVVYAVALGSAP